MDELWKTIAAGLMGAVGVPLILYLWGIFLSRPQVRKFGYRLGQAAAALLNQRLGVQGGEKVQDRIASTLDDFTTGVREGMEAQSEC